MTTATSRKDDTRTSGNLLILGGAAVMLSLAMGMRQSFGLFQPHMIRGLGITAADFSFAIGVQNVVWGVSQPFIGVLADRHGSRPIVLAGVAFYAAGLLFTLFANSAWMVAMGIGACVGLALSCSASNIAMAIASRASSPTRRSVTMGAVSAIGSLGLVLASPMAQALIVSGGWQLAMGSFLVLVLVMLPCAWLAGGVDRLPDVSTGPKQSAGEAIREAASHPGYIVMSIAFFVCGLQLVFLTTHLPTYLDICGIDPSVTASALALIGLFNVVGSYLFGWLGGRYSNRMLLGGLYIARSLAITVYFMSPPTPTSTLIFAAAMGTLWLGVVPLINGLVAHLFGLRFMATLTGVAFLSHQVGSFLGAWGGGLIYSTMGSYDLAWKSAVGIGIAAGLFQMTMNIRPSPRMQAEREAQAWPSAT